MSDILALAPPPRPHWRSGTSRFVRIDVVSCLVAFFVLNLVMKLSLTDCCRTQQSTDPATNESDLDEGFVSPH